MNHSKASLMKTPAARKPGYVLHQFFKIKFACHTGGTYRPVFENLRMNFAKNTDLLSLDEYGSLSSRNKTGIFCFGD
jgi:hypothetical protein